MTSYGKTLTVSEPNSLQDNFLDRIPKAHGYRERKRVKILTCPPDRKDTFDDYINEFIITNQNDIKIIDIKLHRYVVMIIYETL